MIFVTIIVNLENGLIKKDHMNDIKLINDTARNCWVWVNSYQEDLSPEFDTQESAENWYSDISLLFTKKTKTSSFNPKIARLLQPIS